jgi:hypothetical protein
VKNKSPLEHELLLEGANPAEARELSKLASRLPTMRQLPGLPEGLEQGHRQMKRRAIFKKAAAFTSYATAMAAVMVMAGGALAASQSALPGDPLYSVKRSTENIAAAFEPSQHDRIMMNRASEINQLVATHRSPKLINDTLVSYDMAVKKAPGSYAAREYCENMLHTAANQSDPTTRSQIMKSLSRVRLDHT